MPTVYVSRDAIDGLPPRQRRDSYSTPLALAEATITWLYKNTIGWQGKPVEKFVLDPGAGRGIWAEAVRNKIGTWYDTDITGVELRRHKQPPAYTRWYPRTDYLNWYPETKFPYTLIIGNPPFKLAEDFIWRSKDLLSPSGIICFLLPSDFSHSQGRGRGLFNLYRPAWEVSLMQRPQFLDHDGHSLGSANPNNYSLMVWGKEGAAECRKTWLDWNVGKKKSIAKENG